MPPQAHAHEGNIREMREVDGGSVARGVRQLKNSAQLLATDVERAQVGRVLFGVRFARDLRLV